MADDLVGFSLTFEDNVSGALDQVTSNYARLNSAMTKIASNSKKTGKMFSSSFGAVVDTLEQTNIQSEDSAESIQKLTDGLDKASKNVNKLGDVKPIRIQLDAGDVKVGIEEVPKLSVDIPEINIPRVSIDVPEIAIQSGQTVEPLKFATGGIVPGTGGTDTVAAMLTPGEVVLPPNLARGLMNLFSLTPSDMKFAKGGVVSPGDVAKETLVSSSLAVPDIKGDTTMVTKMVSLFSKSVQDLSKESEGFNKVHGLSLKMLSKTMKPLKDLNKKGLEPVEESIRDTKEILEDTGDVTKVYKKQLGDLEDQHGKLGDSMSSVADGFDGMKAGMIGIAATVLTAIPVADLLETEKATKIMAARFGAGAEAAERLTTSTVSLQASLGATNDELREIQDALLEGYVNPFQEGSKLADGFAGDSMAAFNSITANIHKMNMVTGVSVDAMSGLTSTLLMSGKIGGKAINDIVKSFGGLKISSKDMETLVGNVTEYTDVIRKMGFLTEKSAKGIASAFRGVTGAVISTGGSAEEAAEIMNLFQDPLENAVGLQRALGVSVREASDAMQTGNFSQLIEKGFESGQLENFIGQLDSMGPIQKQTFMEGIGLTMEQVGAFRRLSEAGPEAFKKMKAEADIDKAFGTATSSVIESFQRLSGVVLGVMKVAILPLFNWLGKIFSVTADLIEPLLKSISAVGSSVTGIMAPFQGLLSLLGEGAGLTAVVIGLSAAIYFTIPALVAWATASWAAVAPWLPFVAAIAAAITIGLAFTKMLTHANVAIRYVGVGLAILAVAFGSALSPILPIIAAVVLGFFVLKAAVIGLWNGIAPIFSEIRDVLYSAFEPLFEAWQQIKIAVAPIIDMFSNLFSSASDGASSMMGPFELLGSLFQGLGWVIGKTLKFAIEGLMFLMKPLIAVVSGVIKGIAWGIGIVQDMVSAMGGLGHILKVVGTGLAIVFAPVTAIVAALYGLWKIIEYGFDLIGGFSGILDVFKVVLEVAFFPVVLAAKGFGLLWSAIEWGADLIGGFTPILVAFGVAMAIAFWPVTLIVGALYALWKAIEWVSDALWGHSLGPDMLAMVPVIEAVGNILTGVLIPVLDLVAKVIDTVGGVFNNIVDTIGGIFTAMIEGMVTAFQSIPEILQALPDFFQKIKDLGVVGAVKVAAGMAILGTAFVVFGAALAVAAVGVGVFAAAMSVLATIGGGESMKDALLGLVTAFDFSGIDMPAVVSNMEDVVKFIGMFAVVSAALVALAAVATVASGVDALFSLFGASSPFEKLETFATTMVDTLKTMISTMAELSSLPLEMVTQTMSTVKTFISEFASVGAMLKAVADLPMVTEVPGMFGRLFGAESPMERLSGFATQAVSTLTKMIAGFATLGQLPLAVVAENMASVSKFMESVVSVSASLQRAITNLPQEAGWFSASPLEKFAKRMPMIADGVKIAFDAMSNAFKGFDTGVLRTQMDDILSIFTAFVDVLTQINTLVGALMGSMYDNIASGQGMEQIKDIASNLTSMISSVVEPVVPRIEAAVVPATRAPNKTEDETNNGNLSYTSEGQTFSPILEQDEVVKAVKSLEATIIRAMTGKRGKRGKSGGLYDGLLAGGSI